MNTSARSKGIRLELKIYEAGTFLNRCRFVITAAATATRKKPTPPAMEKWSSPPLKMIGLQMGYAQGWKAFAGYVRRALRIIPVFF